MTGTVPSTPPPPLPQPPTPPSSGWTPTTSTVGGAVLGGAVAQLATAAIEQFGHVTLSSATAGALTTLLVAIAGYIFPDGGRR